MKIAVIAPQPFVDIRGTPMANLRLVRALADAGHVVEVITYPFGDPLEYPGVNIRRCPPIAFVRSVGIGFSAAKLLLDISLASCAFRLVRRARFDCIHGVEEGAFIGVFLSRLAAAPLVYDMDSVLSNEISSSLLGKFRPVVWLIRVVERWIIRKAALVMTISESMAAYVRQIDPSKPVAVVPDIPIAIPASGANPDRAREQMPLEFPENSCESYDRKIIMYTGSLAGYQGLDLLVSAMARVITRAPEAMLVVVGGNEKDIKRLTSMAEIAGMMRNLLLLGKKPPDQIPDFLGAADVLVSPRRGGINPPAKIYTYMQSGKPIVATNIPAHTTVLDRDAAVLVEPTPEGIAEGILWTLGHSQEAGQKAARAREIVSKITPELQARRIVEAYELVRRNVEMRGAQASN